MKLLASALLPVSATVLAVTTVSTVVAPTTVTDDPRPRTTPSRAETTIAPPPPGSSHRWDRQALAVPGAASAAAQTVAPTVAPRGRWSWPLDPRPTVARPFVRPTSTWGAGHRGVDLATATGGKVLAVDDGIVAHVGVIAGRGTVTVLHGSGLRSTYEPVDAAVSVGDAVRRGERLGSVTTGSHCAPSTCLHLGALRGDAYLDPLTLLGATRVRLLPLR